MKSIFFIVVSLEVGGAQQQIILLSRYFINNGYSVNVISLYKTNSLQNKFLENGINVCVCDLTDKFNFLKNLFRIYLILRKNQVATILTFSFHANIVGRIIGTIAGSKKIISSVRTGLYPSKFRRYLEKATSVMCRKVVFNSSIVAESFVEKRVYSSTKICVIPNCVESSINVSVSSCIKNWVTIGRLHPSKDYYNLLYAFKKYLIVFPDHKLDIIGYGPLLSGLEFRLGELELKNNVQILQNLDNAQNLLHKYDAYVCSSVIEGSPNSILEAMARGLPVVSTDVGGIPEIINSNINGYLVRPECYLELAQTMIKLARISEKELLCIKSANIEQVSQVHSLSSVGQKWNEIISN